MKKMSFLIKPASSMCNLKCKYCFYADVSNHREVKNHGVMNEKTMNALIHEAFLNLDEDGELTFAFQGGEPTVAGLAFYENFCQCVDQIKKATQKVNYAIQSNSMLIDEKWCKLFQKYDFLVGVSLDGYKENHDAFRITQNNKATFKQVMKAIDLLRKYQVRFNVLTVLSRQLAKHPEKLYAFYKQEKIEYIQLIPCLAGLDEVKNPFALTPELFAGFYKSFYDLWLKDYQLGIYRSVNLFDNLIPMFADIPPYQCGALGFCSLQFVVESDGSIYPCDFYVLDEYKGGNINEKPLMEIAQSEKMQQFLKEEKKMSLRCDSCQFINICHGNCKRMSSLYFKENYCGYQDFLNHAANSMIQIAAMLKKGR